jgi:hypothetical protein
VRPEQFEDLQADLETAHLALKSACLGAHQIFGRSKPRPQALKRLVREIEFVQVNVENDLRSNQFERVREMTAREQASLHD